MESVPTLSIIIPVYNAASYLRGCVSSILSQTFVDFEVILINDGSTDDSLAILQEFAKSDARIRVISQQNQGVSAARNTGLKASRGTFITFIDSDDIISPDYLSNFIFDSSYGFQLQGMELVYVDNESENRAVLPPVSEDCTLKRAYEVAELTRLSRGPCLKLFLADIIRTNQLRFRTDVSFGEDALFVKEYILCAPRSARLIAKADYRYMHYPSSHSLVHKYHDPRKRYIVTSEDLSLFKQLEQRLGRFNQEVTDDFLRERALEMFDELHKSLFDKKITKKDLIEFWQKITDSIYHELAYSCKLPITYKIFKFVIDTFGPRRAIKFLQLL